MLSVYVLTVEAVSSDPRAAPGSNAAYISVYTTAPSEANARSVALREVAEAGWHCVNIDSVSKHTESDYPTERPGREYFEQALVDGIVLVVHSFPLEKH